MSSHRLPAPAGQAIDRGRPIRLTFNGQGVEGFAGDTVASALLANGIKHVGRSYKLHRPRGIVSCGVEEPTGVVDVGSGALRTPNTRLTDIMARDGLSASSGNFWPTLEFDVGALLSKFGGLMPAGFYYKTFMWPHWQLFEPAIRQLAAASRAGSGPDPERYDEVSVTTDVLVVGAGPAGIEAALAAAGRGRQVRLLEAGARIGGWFSAQSLQPNSRSQAQIQDRYRDLKHSGVVLHERTTAIALYDHNLVTAIECLEGADTPGVLRERLWKIRARQVILATGAFERPMLFPDNDRPGVMLAGAVERYAVDYGVACGRQVVLAAACDSAYSVACSLRNAGIHVAAIVDRRGKGDVGAIAPDGIDVLYESVVIGVEGTRSVQGVQVASLSGGSVRRIDADVVASAGGFTPNVNLYSQAGGRLRWQSSSAMFIPDRQLSGVAIVGAAAGAFDMQASIDHARFVGSAAPGDSVQTAPVGGAGVVPADNRPTAAALSALNRKAGKIFIDLQNDVTSGDVELAAREGYRSVEHLKRYTTTGMATDQGKTSNVNALVVMGLATARSPEQVGTTKFRPPYKPVTLNAMAAGRTGARYRPLKPLPARAWHAGRGALFEEFGGWERPAAYPMPGEDLAVAAEREAAQVRIGVGLFDGSPLGKIEIYGPDAADFLDLMYVGTMSTIPIGGARYGVVLNENGIVVDDGIVARLGPNHFWVNTTSGGADRAVLAFEEWLQCEYVQHRVCVVPMTSQWGNVTVSGPNAWKLLSKVGLDPALDPASMKHMTMREVPLHGNVIRVLRASFNGELGYEINLPAAQSEPLFERLWAAGHDLGVCAYGVEALMIMRLEKGFIHVGADTDGTTLPQDVGLARGVDKKGANFVGRRSLSRPAGKDPDRLQLVGLQPLDRRTRLPVGAHLSLKAPPAQAEGFITSSAYSPSLQQPIALALLKGGAQRIGERLQAWHLGAAIEAEVVKTPFFDPAGERIRG